MYNICSDFNELILAWSALFYTFVSVSIVDFEQVNFQVYVPKP